MSLALFGCGGQREGWGEGIGGKGRERGGKDVRRGETKKRGRWEKELWAGRGVSGKGRGGGGEDSRLERR